MKDATQATIHLDRLTRNLRRLEEIGGQRPLWPCIKANAYGHGLQIVAEHLVQQGVETLCVANVAEGVALREMGLEGPVVILSASAVEACESIVAYRLEPVVCSREMLEGLAREVDRQERTVSIHLKVDTGMGRVGLAPDEIPALATYANSWEGIRIRGLMSHFPLADEPQSPFSRNQIEIFDRVCRATEGHAIEFRHMANSAALFDWPESHYDALRPGISIYGLQPSPGIANPRVAELEPVLEWTTRITFLKEVPAGVGLSYGHTFRTERPSLIATFPAGYGDGLARSLSNRMQVLVGGEWCPQVGTITMDQTLVDVTALRDRVNVGDEVVLVGQQGDEVARVDRLAAALGTINYEIVTGLSARVPRVAVGASSPAC